MMKIGLHVIIDFVKIKSIDDFYDEMTRVFGFPAFFGRNGNAFIDCLFSLRYPQDEMTAIHIRKDEYIIMELVNFSSASQNVKDTLIISIEFVSMKCKEKGQEPSILLLCR